MARNASTNEDIPYKYTIDEIRLRVISDSQESYNMYMNNIHVLPSMEELSENSISCTTLDVLGRTQKLVIDH